MKTNKEKTKIVQKKLGIVFLSIALFALLSCEDEKQKEKTNLIEFVLSKTKQMTAADGSPCPCSRLTKQTSYNYYTGNFSQSLIYFQCGSGHVVTFDRVKNLATLCRSKKDSRTFIIKTQKKNWQPIDKQAFIFVD